METLNYDIIIVGCGLAGLSAAGTIAQGSDASVLILGDEGLGNKNQTPLIFADVAERFNLDRFVVGRYRRFIFHSFLGNRSIHTYDTHPLVTLDYRRACTELLRHNQTGGNVSIGQSKATSLHRTSGGFWQLEIADGQTITTPLLVDASGASLFSTRALGLPMPKMFSHCYGQTLLGSFGAEPAEVFFLAPCNVFGDGGGWFYPLSDGRTSFGYATLSKTANYPESTVKDRYHRALKEFRPYSDWLGSAKPCREEIGSIPICPPRRFVYDGLALVGDAAGLATIWSCMGVEQALVSGQLAGRAMVDAHCSRDYSARTLGTYQYHWDRDYRRIYQQGALIADSIWRQKEESWNKQISLSQQLTPEQKLAQLRTNGPLLPFWQILFIKLYDLLGRTRRKLWSFVSNRH